MNCSVPANQPIYQALLDKAASYHTDNLYNAKAYNKAAQSVLTHTWNIYDIAKNNSWHQGQGQYIAGEGIRTFIKDFIRTEVFPPEKYSEKAAEAARKIAAQNDPTVTIDHLRTALGLDTKPVEKPKTALDFYYESLKSVVYTNKNPRRSARIAAKATCS